MTNPTDKCIKGFREEEVDEIKKNTEKDKVEYKTHIDLRLRGAFAVLDL